MACLRSSRKHHSRHAGADQQRIKRLLFRYLIIVLPLLLAGCEHKPPDYFASAAECPPGKVPTDTEFERMPYPEFYRWHKMANEADDTIAAARARGVSFDDNPCTVALALKSYVLNRMMNYR
jgi:hypothetical protein